MGIHYVPILTTLFTAYFAAELFSRYRRKPGSYNLLWWGFGVVAYGIGTLVESLITIFGWSDILFRLWYVAGAMMGGAPLAQGTVYLLLKRRTAHILSAALVLAITFGAIVTFLTPLDYSLVDPKLPQGNVIVWQWIRLISPFINTYAVIFLVGGAIASAIKFSKIPKFKNRFVGNTLIAIGAILPGIGGAMSRAGHTEVLYLAEFVGIIFIFAGYRRCSRDPAPIIHPVSQELEDDRLVQSADSRSS
ncbi:MAG: hypothetical protein IIB00_06000 [candidate division Zixibacteria bacterium]|nr:hypothetical protein [candidate division Zixibacteria bacterium]